MGTSVEYLEDTITKKKLNDRELIWAVYSAIQAMSSNKNYQTLAQGWQAWPDYTKLTAAKVSSGAVVLQSFIKLLVDILCRK